MCDWVTGVFLYSMNYYDFMNANIGIFIKKFICSWYTQSGRDDVQYFRKRSRRITVATFVTSGIKITKYLVNEQKGSRKGN